MLKSFILIIFFEKADQDDIIDETLNFLRANVFFRNYDVRGGADRTLIYLTLFAILCLVKCEKIEDKASGRMNAFNSSLFTAQIFLKVSQLLYCGMLQL
jgi:hypothetical protein